MLTPAMRLKEKLASGIPVVGMMETDHVWPLLVEVCQRAGLDYLVVDNEHGAFSSELIAHICQIGRLAEFPVMMRTVSCEMSVLRKAIDMGPCGLLLPCVESAAQLDAVRDAVRMPPRGKRRPGGMGNYWMRDFQYETWRDDFEDFFIVIPQIETRQGVENAGEIAAHPLVTALGVGPYDLSADLGCCWNPDDEQHKQALRRIREAADAAGKKVWMRYHGPTRIDEGYTFLWVGSSAAILGKGFSDVLHAIEQAGKNRSATET